MSARPSIHEKSRRVRRLLAVLAFAVLGSAGAAVGAEVPEGIPAGPWVLTPSLVMGYSEDSNIFLASENSVYDVRSDHIIRAQPGLVATLPFHDSFLRLDYEWTHTKYGNPQEIDRNDAHDLGAGLSLGFASRDRLSLGARWYKGVAETLAFDPGGEAIYQGEGFDLRSQEVALNREVYGRRGYKIRVSHEDLSFPPGAEEAFFEYRGFQGEATYREPLSPALWFVAAYEGRRYDHYVSDESVEMSGFPRQERSDIGWLGFQGRAGKRHTFVARAGYASFRFPGGVGSDFRGLVLDANVAMLGTGTRLTLRLLRRPWPSFVVDNSYYLVESVQMRIERRWLRYSSVGFDASLARSEYGDPTALWRSPGAPVESVLRRDTTYRCEAYANLMFRERIGVRISVLEHRRDSNYVGYLRVPDPQQQGGFRYDPVGADYDGRVYFVGLAYGWL